MEKLSFVSVEFPDDPNVAGLTYWYYCPVDGAEVGDMVIAPLGRRNGRQRGIIRAVTYCGKENSPYPFNLIKNVIKLEKRETEDIKCIK